MVTKFASYIPLDGFTSGLTYFSRLWR